jgi:hypothetical protein
LQGRVADVCGETISLCKYNSDIIPDERLKTVHALKSLKISPSLDAMTEIETQMQHDASHRKPVVDDFEIPVLSYSSTGDRTSEKTRYADIDSQADASVVSAPSRKQVKKGWLKFITLCWTLFLTGWSDGTTGPLLPRIQEVYHVVFVEDLKQENTDDSTIM